MSNNLTRRSVMQTTAVAGALAVTGTPALAAPKRGGVLRIGLRGANTSDNWDSRTHADTFMIMMAHGCVFECLTEVAAEGTLVGELAESWTSSPDAKIWTFKLRKGVKFHNGKSFGVDDVMESLKMHTAEDSKSAAKPIVSDIETMEKVNEHEVRLVLKSGSADFPFLLADYHLCIYPAGMIEEAIAKGIGTGPYKVVSFDPGARCVVTRVDDHHLADSSGYFDGIEAIAINDASARSNALVTGQVDVANELDRKIVPLVKANSNLAISEVTSNQHQTFPMLVENEPFNDINVRKAIKYSVNRQEMVDKIHQGFASIGNDSPIGPANQYYADDIPQLAYDPDMAKHYLKKSGRSSLDVDLSTSDAAFAGAVDAAQLLQNSAKAAGININIIQEPADGYWSNVWLRKPWCACYWSGRATEDWMWKSAYEKGVPWNDTGWHNERFQNLMLMGRVELDSNKRREIYREMQMIISAEGGTIIPTFSKFVDGYSTKVAHHPTVGNVYTADNSRIPKRWWFA